MKTINYTEKAWDRLIKAIEALHDEGRKVAEYERQLGEAVKCHV